jgi:GxxExxY protein
MKIEKAIVTQDYVNDIAYKIVACAIEVHKTLGPGLLESIYHTCLIEELEQSGLIIESQVEVPVKYKGKDIGGKPRIDILVNELIIVELKSVESILPVHKAQLLSYMKLAHVPKGLLINFNCDNIVKQMVPLVNEIFSNLSKE